MKSILIILIVSSSISICAQEQLHQALKDGNADLISSFFGETVTISIFEQDQSLKKEKAIAMTKNFFDAHKISGFTLMHEGASRDLTSQYLIGRMASKDQNFRVFINYQNVNEQLIINELRIEKG